MSAQSIDLAFGLVGTSPIPADHGYALYAAISRVLPALHEPNGIGIHAFPRSPTQSRRERSLFSS